MVDKGVQSRVRMMAMVESSEEERSFERVGKWRDVRLEEWWRREPSSLFEGLEDVGVVERVGRRDGLEWEEFGGGRDRGGVVERE